MRSRRAGRWRGRPAGRAARRVEPGRDGDRDRDQECQSGQLGRSADRRGQLRQDAVGDVRVAEVERDDATIESTYCTMSGRSVPSCLLSASTLSWGANGPRIVRPTSFGQDVGDDEDDRDEQPQREERRSRRRPMNRAIGTSPGWRTRRRDDGRATVLTRHRSGDLARPSRRTSGPRALERPR